LATVSWLTRPCGTDVEPRSDAFSDVEIKAVLDNCRLDYVYEPDWPRLVARTCNLLASAKTVAWFQNAQRPDASAAMAERVVLSDPTARFVRENINGFLLGRPLDSPLPIIVSTAHASDLLTDPPPMFQVRLSEAKANSRSAFGAALGADGRCLTRVIDPAVTTAMGELCDAWHAHTERSVLVAVDFALDGGRPVAEPRSAVQAFFSSAIDALIIGRFLLMKDYWLMRSGT
jgi:carbamoyltransferase